MAYMNQQKKAVIAAKVKPILKKYGLKGSLSVQNHMAISLNIKSGPIDFGDNRIQVNTYWLDDHYKDRPKALAALKELKEETGIVLDKECDEMIEFEYVKGGIMKLMDVYVYCRDKSEITQYLNGWTVKTDFYDLNEIIGAKFFNLNTTCRKKIDISMIKLIDRLNEE